MCEKCKKSKEEVITLAKKYGCNMGLTIYIYKSFLGTWNFATKGCIPLLATNVELIYEHI